MFLHLEEIRLAAESLRRILIIRDYQCQIPPVFPEALADIKHILKENTTLVYMAEYFSECVEKIQKEMGPSDKIVSLCVKNEDSLRFVNFFQRILNQILDIQLRNLTKFHFQTNPYSQSSTHNWQTSQGCYY